MIKFRSTGWIATLGVILLKDSKLDGPAELMSSSDEMEAVWLTP
jgi:hypothetical protein